MDNIFLNYSTRIVRHNRSYNILKYFTVEFLTLDIIFIITSLVLKFMEITETEMKEQENEHTIHTNEHKM
jgi:hypothetical protein